MAKNYFYSLILFPIFPIIIGIGIPFADTNAQLPPDFVEVNIADDLNRPVGIIFDNNGQAYVWEKRGIVRIIDSMDQLLPVPLLDISDEVGDWGDHGMLGFTLDPDFLDNGFFYTLYVVDRHHLLFADSPAYNPDSSIYTQATIGRITRYQADASTGYTTLVANSRKVLLGETIDAGIPILVSSHGVGSLFFGTDGTLLASTGETGSFTSNDTGNNSSTYFQQGLADGILQAHENVGALRSQLIDNLNGKLLRIDPETGDGLASNPYYNENNPRAPRSRVYALGLRNPFRCILQPETGSHNPEEGNPGIIIIGDVGGNQWEEINICHQPGMNFGWPLYEGILPKNSFYNQSNPNTVTANPYFEIDNCEQAYYTFQDLLQQPTEQQFNDFHNPCNPGADIDSNYTHIHALPTIAYPNKVDNQPARTLIPTFDQNGNVDTLNIVDSPLGIQGIDINGITSIAGVFYEGDQFPEDFHGKYFHADYNGWIHLLAFDNNRQLQSIDPFHSHSEKILSLALNPVNGCLYYVSIQSKVQRICYGGNNPPVAKAIMDMQYGPAPHPVQFHGAASYDPEGTTLDYLWDFGDGTTSAEKNPAHVFNNLSNLPEKFIVTLTVTDSLGASAQEELIVSINNTPPQVRISSFQDSATYSTNGLNLWPLDAEVFDTEQSATSLAYSWTVILKHNTHEHAEAPLDQRRTTVIIEPLGCSPEETYWYEIQLAVKDSFGLTGRDTSSIFPYCGDPFFELAYWRGEAKAEQIDLNWSSIDEAAIEFYLLQKTTGTQGLEILDSIEAKGANLNYLIADPQPINGYNNYRLQAFKIDGSYEFSPEISVLYPAIPAVKIFPNPVSGSCFVEVAEPAETIILELFDLRGSLVHRQIENTDHFTVSLKNLPPGIYTYRLWNGQVSHSGQVVKTP